MLMCSASCFCRSLLRVNTFLLRDARSLWWIHGSLLCVAIRCPFCRIKRFARVRPSVDAQCLCVNRTFLRVYQLVSFARE